MSTSLKPTLAACLAVLAWGGSAIADEIRVNNIWVSQVEVVSVANGQVHYFTSAGAEKRRPITEVTGIRLEKYPGYEKAFAAIAEGNDAPAIELLLTVRRKALRKDPWVVYEMGRQLVSAYDRQGEGARAAAMYIDLIDRGADQTFLATPPLASVRALPEVEKARLRPKLAKAVSRAPKLAQDAAGQLLTAAAAGNGEAISLVKKAKLAIGGRYPAVGGVLLPESLGRSEVGDLVFAGEFDAAIAAADDAMNKRARSEMMFLRATARLGLARQTKDADGYKDAGLDYMRVVVYFPSSPQAGPALLELAVIHDQLGREGVAATLFDEAGRVLSAKEHPRYHRRYTQLMAVRKK